MKKLLLTTLILLAFAGAAFGETLTIQPSTADTYIDNGFPDTNRGSYPLFNVMESDSRSVRGLFRFDWPTLPANANIINATANLSRYYDNGTAGGYTYWIYSLCQAPDFSEDATWNKYDGVNVWDPPHVRSPASGCYTTYLGASLVVDNFVSEDWLIWTVTDLIKWYQYDGGMNFILKCETQNSPGYGFGVRSREYTTDPTLQPKLIITYTVPVPYSYIF
jgi:hypothetical protein